MESVESLLLPKGIHCIECPKYDFPFYNPNSLNHIGIVGSIMIKIKLIFRHIPFSIISDPAIFYLPFKIDRDAIHYVREKDIFNFYRKKNTNVFRYLTFIPPPLSLRKLKNYIVQKYLICRIVIQLQ